MKLDNRLQTAAWGIMIILFGGLGLVPGDQTRFFVLGIGVILLGLNFLRYVNQIPMNGFSTLVGAVSLLLGGIATIRPMLGWKSHLELPFFPILLIIFGLYLLLPSSQPKKNR
jgi:hypothetical protein